MAKISKKPPSDDDSPKSPGETIQFLMENMLEGIEEGGRSKEMGALHQAPHVDIFSTKEELVIEVDLPGVKADEINISLDREQMNIHAAKYECFDDDKINYICMERAFGKIARTIHIPLPVNSSKVKATYDKGILTIRMPRIEDKRGKAKKIPVKSGSGK